MAAEIPPAQLKYYEEHASDNQQPNLIATIVLCLALPCIAVALRFLARWRTHAGFKADDWLILLALFPCAGMSTTTGLGIRYVSMAILSQLRLTHGEAMVKAGTLYSSNTPKVS